MEDHHVVAVILRRGDQLLLCHRSPGGGGIRMCGTSQAVTSGLASAPKMRSGGRWPRNWGAGLEGVDGGPVLHRVDPQAGLDLTVWVSWRWRGTVSNLQPEEHDAIGWFEEGQLDGLRFADPSYLPLLRRLLSV